MASRVQIIDVTKSFVPWDPEAFPNQYIGTQQEDFREPMMPVVGMEGWNILPTTQGYKSYFGTGAKFDILPLASRAQWILLYQDETYQNHLVAMCEDGIWLNSLKSGAAWIKQKSISFEANVVREWTWTVIENVLYMYVQGNSEVYTIDGSYVTIPSVPPVPTPSPPNYWPNVYAETTVDNASIQAVNILGAAFGVMTLVLQRFNANGSRSNAIILETPNASDLFEVVLNNATIGDKYRVSMKFAVAPDVLYSLVCIVDSSGKLTVEATNSKHRTKINPATLLTPALFQYTFHEVTPVVTYSGSFIVDTSSSGLPAGSYDIYAALDWNYPPYTPSAEDPISLFSLPYKIGTINLPVAANVSGNFGGPETSATADYYRILALNTVTGDVFETTAIINGHSPGYFSFNLPPDQMSENVLDQRISYSYVPGQPTNSLKVDSFVPTFLNMSGQLGLFRAHTRLGFWDSENSVSWSSNIDIKDFKPDLGNLAGASIFGAVKGRIISIKAFGTGFIIYSTRSIVGVTETLESSMLWSGQAIFDNVGIGYSRAVCEGQSDSEHFAYTNQGIIHLNGFDARNSRFSAEFILTEVYDFLKEDRLPVALTCLGSRYIMFSLIDDKYISGRVTFDRHYVHPLVTNVKLSDGYWDGDITVLPETFDGNTFYQILRTIIAGNAGGLDTRLARHWETTWSGEVVRMDTDIYTAAERIGWFRDIPGYEHPLSNHHWANAHFKAVEAIGNNEALPLEDLTPTLVRKNDGTSNAYWKAGDFTIPFFPLTYDMDDAGFDVLEEGDVGSKIYLQMQEWDNFKTTQERTASFITGKAAPNTTPGGILGTFLAGDGPVKILMPDRHTIVLRKYFTHEFKIYVNRIETPPDPPYEAIVDWVGPQSSTNYVNPNVGTPSPAPVPAPYPISVGMRLNDITAGVVGYALSIVGNNPYGGSTDGPTVLSDPQFGAVASYNNHPTSFTVPGIEDTITGYAFSGRGVIIQTFGRPMRSESYSQYAVIVQGPFTPEGISISGTPNAQSNSSSIPFTVEYRANPPVVTGTSYNVGYTALEEPVISEVVFRCKEYKLVEPRIGNTARIIATYPVSSYKDIPFNNLYPDLTRLPPAVASNIEQFWLLEDSNGSLHYSQLPMNWREGTFGGYPITKGDMNEARDPLSNAPYTILGYTIAGSYHPPVYLEFTLPGSEYVIQKGSIIPQYLTFQGSLVWDMHLKKWGKFKGSHKLLIETAPVNTNKDGLLDYTNFGTEGGILDANGEVRIFDASPTDSYIGYGKIGFIRAGVTHIQQINAHFRFPFTGTLRVDYSLDGRTIEPSLRQDVEIHEALSCDVLVSQRARWAIVKLLGKFDLKYLEVCARIAGKREGTR